MNSTLLDTQQKRGELSPLQLFFTVAATILVGEIAIMFLLMVLPPLPQVTESLMDGMLLTIVVSPVLYLYLYLPMTRQITDLERTEGLLRQHQDYLEEKVQQRTAELVKSNQQITDREAHYRAVVEGATEGIVTLNEQGRIVRINTAAEKMLGYAHGETDGMEFNGLFSAEGNKEYHGADGGIYPVSGVSLDARGKTGEIIPVLLTLSPFVYENGRYFSAIIVNMSERVMFEKRLARLAYYDSLTGLPNRRLFHDRLEQALKRATRNEKLVGILFLDLDHFKNVNDTLCHLFGDLLLQEVAKRLSGMLRKEDTIARLGGDEFTLVLENISNVQDVDGVVSKILHSFREPFVLGSHEIFVTTSIGITIFPMDDNDIEKLIMNADSAMYQAKTQGRNTYQLYTAKISSDIEQRVVLDTALRKAVGSSELMLNYQPEFVLHYQPEVDRYSGEVVGAEALVRWQHPDLGLLGPDKFIPLAEQTGLIVPIGHWVLRAACQQAVAWRAAGLPPMHIAVNVSAVQLKQDDFVQQVKSVLESTGLEGRYLELEITESMIVDKTEKLITMLRDLKAMGIKIAIDDFGTGHASLANLQLLPIDKVKIDLSFIRNLPTSESDAAIVNSIIEMAHKLGMEVVAEGVETEEQLMYLHAHKCDIMQGFHFSRPVPANDLEALLSTNVEFVSTPG